MVSKLIHASEKKKWLKHLFMLVKKDKMVQNFIHASKGDCGVGERVVKEKEGPATKKREK